MMADVFAEERGELSDAHIERLLGRADFWAVAALDGEEVIGGITAHTLPMTRTESYEVFVYDLAVRPDHQRRGVGRQLVTHLRRAAADAGFGDVFVPVDDDDLHAIDFYRAVGGTPSRVTIFTFTRDDD